MKTFSAIALSVAFLYSGLSQTPSQPLQIYVSADHSFRGPFTHSPATLTGEAVVTLTADQYAALNVVRGANPAATRFAFDGTNFTVAPIESLRLGLGAIYSALPAGEQELFAPQFEGVKRRLAANDVAGALLIVSLSGTGMPQDIATARTQMLAQFAQNFPTVTVTP